MCVVVVVVVIDGALLPGRESYITRAKAGKAVKPGIGTRFRNAPAKRSRNGWNRPFSGPWPRALRRHSEGLWFSSSWPDPSGVGLAGTGFRRQTEMKRGVGTMRAYATESRPAQVAHRARLVAAGAFIVGVTAAGFTTALLFASGILGW